MQDSRVPDPNIPQELYELPEIVDDLVEDAEPSQGLSLNSDGTLNMDGRTGNMINIFWDYTPPGGGRAFRRWREWKKMIEDALTVLTFMELDELEEMYANPIGRPKIVVDALPMFIDAKAKNEFVTQIKLGSGGTWTEQQV